MKRSPIRRKPRARKGPDELERMAAFKLAAMYQAPCLVCGSETALVAHHVVHCQHVAKAGGDIWSPANAMCLCSGPTGCHEAHHNRTRPIPGPCVPSAAGKFAIELLGKERAVAYFERYYDCSPHTSTKEN